MVRFYTPNLDEACDALDLYDIDYDLDDGDRIMVDDSLYDDALDAFDEAACKNRKNPLERMTQ